MNPKTLYEWMKDRFMERQNKVEDKLFDILSKRHEAIFNKEYPSISSRIFKKIITGEIKPNPREKWNELLHSMGIITTGADERMQRLPFETKKKPAKEGYVCVYDPGNPGYVLVPIVLAEKIIVLGYLP